MWIVRMILLKNKKGIARGKLSEVEERIFGRDCRDGCIHK